MAYEKPLALKILGWILYGGGTLLKTMFEMSNAGSTDSLTMIRERRENGRMGTAEYLERRSKIMGD